MTIWNRVRHVLPDWLWPVSEPSDTTKTDSSADQHLAQAADSLQALLSDNRVPAEVRDGLESDFAQVRAMLDKLEQGHLHIAVIGEVSVGKSSLLNAMLGERRFSTSPLHGETKNVQHAAWQQHTDGALILIDTPGLNEIGGEDRERMAKEVADRADLILFVIDGDATDSEAEALRALAATNRPTIVVLNKSDRYSTDERVALRQALLTRMGDIIAPENLVETSAEPMQQVVVRVAEDGTEREEIRQPTAQLSALKDRLWEVIEAEGKTLSALNASLFASDLSERVAERVLDVRQDIGQTIIRNYSLGKGLAVALNPIPVADLITAAAADVGMIVHLSNAYGLPMTKAQSGKLIGTITGQLLLIMGTGWAVHALASLLKAGTGGLSTVLTASAQGAVAYYTTYIVGQVAQSYLAAGQSWGEGGAKKVVKNIVDDIDKESLLAQAKADILQRIGR